MLKTAEKFLEKYNIKDKTIIIGFSAGPDSCALALLLNKLKEKYNLKIILAYFNHNWRKEAIKEEEFTKNFAQKFNNLFYIKKAGENVKKNEETARILRYEFFEQCALEFDSEFVFLAHNKNDNIETLIYRIIKGTSLKGLCAIPEKRGVFYRPLLEIEKKEILEFLKENKQNFMIDSSNNDIKYRRNLIRCKILPIFEKINPNYVNNINNLIKNSINARKIVDSKITETQKEIIKDKIINKSRFVSLGIEFRLEILNNFLGEYLKYRDYKNLKKFDDFILKNNELNKGSKTSINSNLFLCIKKDKIFIEKIDIERK